MLMLITPHQALRLYIQQMGRQKMKFLCLSFQASMTFPIKLRRVWRELIIPIFIRLRIALVEKFLLDHQIKPIHKF